MSVFSPERGVVATWRSCSRQGASVVLPGLTPRGRRRGAERPARNARLRGTWVGRRREVARVQHTVPSTTSFTHLPHALRSAGAHHRGEKTDVSARGPAHAPSDDFRSPERYGGPWKTVAGDGMPASPFSRAGPDNSVPSDQLAGWPFSHGPMGGCSQDWCSVPPDILTPGRRGCRGVGAPCPRRIGAPCSLTT